MIVKCANNIVFVQKSLVKILNFIIFALDFN